MSARSRPSRRPAWQALRGIVRGATIAAAGLVCVAVVVAIGLAAAGYRPVVIQTGSMGDAAPPGSLVIAAPVDHVAIGDVLVMRQDGRSTVTHRVVDLEERPTGLVAVTRGDANPDIDPLPYELGDEELVARWVVPDAGSWLLRLRTPAIALTVVTILVATTSFVALRRIWGVPTRSARAPTLPAAGTDPDEREASTDGRRRRILIGAATVSGALVVSSVVFSLYVSVDSVSANSFSTGPCYDARLGSVQTGQHVNDTDGVSTVAITAVDPARSFLLMSHTSSVAEPDESMIAGRLASTTSLEFVRATDDVPPADIVVEWAVVEYDCGVSVQRGTAASGGAGSVDVPISSVDPASSFALLSIGAAAGAADFDEDDLVSVGIADPTTLRLQASAAIPAATPLEWQVVTFDGGDISTQQLSASFGATDTVVNVTIPSTVDPESTAVFTSARFTGTGIDIGDRMIRARLVDGDTVELSRGVGNDTLDVVVQVVEFADGTTVRHGVLDLDAAESQGTVSIPPVQPNRSTVSSTVMIAGGLSGGSTVHTADDSVGEASARITLADERTVDVRRDATASDSSFAWQVITWNGPNWADLDAPFRRRIDVAGGSVLTPTGYTTALTLDHADLVSQGLSLTDGTDLRVWRHDGVAWAELHRVLDDASAWNDPGTTFWFRTQESIAADDTVSYWLYFGDSTPDPVLNDPAEVWLAVEGFDDGTLGVFEDRTAASGWYDDQPWTRRIVIDIDGSGLGNPVVGHPVLIDVTDADLATHAAADGTDLRFTADDGTTVLPHQIESWDQPGGRLTAWVRVPTVSMTSTSIHLYYGSADAADQQAPRATWADERAVWLLAGDPATDHPSLEDEAPGQHDGVALADAVAASTPTGPGVELDGSLDRLESAPFVLPDAPFTVTAHVRVDSLPADVSVVRHGDPAAGGGFDLAVTTPAGPTAEFRLGVDGSAVAVSGGSLTLGAWHHLAATWDRATLRLFVDGVQVDAAAATGSLTRAGALPVVIGGDAAGTSTLDGIAAHVDISARFWTVDEVKLRADLHGGSRVSAAPSTAGTWFEQGSWTTRWPLVVDADAVAGTLTDFPLLLHLTDATLGSTARADGLDLVVTGADGVTRLDHWIESWDGATGELTAWVRVPDLAATDDTTLYLYAGNASASDQQDAAAVWGPDVDLIVTDSS